MRDHFPFPASGGIKCKSPGTVAAIEIGARMIGVVARCGTRKGPTIFATFLMMPACLDGGLRLPGSAAPKEWPAHRTAPEASGVDEMRSIESVLSIGRGKYNLLKYYV